MALCNSGGSKDFNSGVRQQSIAFSLPDLTHSSQWQSLFYGMDGNGIVLAHYGPAHYFTERILLKSYA